MGMGWKDKINVDEISRKKCSCGLGEVIVQHVFTEESEYPPFYRGGSDETFCTCKNTECSDFVRYGEE